MTDDALCTAHRRVCNAEIIGISDGSSVYAWRCAKCGGEWPRHATMRGKHRMNNSPAAPAYAALPINPPVTDDAIPEDAVEREAARHAAELGWAWPPVHPEHEAEELANAHGRLSKACLMLGPGAAALLRGEAVAVPCWRGRQTVATDPAPRMTQDGAHLTAAEARRQADLMLVRDAYRRAHGPAWWRALRRLPRRFSDAWCGAVEGWRDAD